MKLHLSPRKIAIALSGIFASYLLTGWLVLPHIVQSQSEKYILEKSGHHLAMELPEFNPLTMKLHLSGLRLTEPDGQALLSFRDLNVNFSMTSLFHRSLDFDSIELDEPTISVKVLHDGKLNWSALTAALSSNEKPSPSPLPRISIQKFVLTHGHINFSDTKTAFSTELEPVKFELDNLSTLPDRQGNYTLEANTATGARISWQGKVALSPLAASGNVNITNFKLVQLQPYLKNIGKLSSGLTELSMQYQLKPAETGTGLIIDNLLFKTKELHINIGGNLPDLEVGTVEGKNGHFDLLADKLTLDSLVMKNSSVHLTNGDKVLQALELDSLTAEKIRLDIAKRNVTLDLIAMQAGKIKAVRNSLGEIDLLAALQTLSHSQSARENKSKTPTAAWHYHAEKLAIENFSVALHDESVKPAADLALQHIDLNLTGISDNLTKPLPVRLSLSAASGGDLDITGNVVPGDATADLQVKLSGLALQPVQPYLATIAKLQLVSGQLTTQGHVVYDKRNVNFKGAASLDKLRLLENDTRDTLIAWTSVTTQDIEANAKNLNIGTLDVEGLESKFIFNKDKSINVTRILNLPATKSPVTPTLAAAAKPANPPDISVPSAGRPDNAPTFQTNIERIKMKNGAMFYADYSLVMPFATRIQKLHGYLTGIGQGRTGKIELDGQVDDYGLAHATGQIKFFDPTDLTDISVLFSNVEMDRLTPYSGTFAGRKIDSGKMTLNIEYKINERQLSGNNKIVIDKLILGEKVASPDAGNWPLDLVIAILQDSDGVIHLGLPVTGSLDDPKFSFSGIIRQAISNVMTRIATAPLRMLGALFGGTEEKFGIVEFEAGKSHLTPPEREKLVRLADMLNTRPNLALTIQGVYANSDRTALQDRQLRSLILNGMGVRIPPNEDPGPVSTQEPKAQAAMESLYARDVGRGELNEMKAAYRKENPGRLTESSGEKLVSRLSRLFRNHRALSEQEMAQLKGADFYTVLFQKLLEKQLIDESQLESLGELRGNYVMDFLKSSGAPADRITLLPVTKVADDNHKVAVKIDAGVASK